MSSAPIYPFLILWYSTDMIGKKRIFIICISLLITAGLILGICFYTKKLKTQNKTIRVGFYNVQEDLSEVIAKKVSELCQANEQNVSFVNITSCKDLISNDKKNKPDLIFASDGYAVRKTLEASQKNADLSSEILSAMFSSMQESVKYEDGKIKAVPLLFDNLEIDIEKAEFNMSGMKAINTWEDIERFCAIQKTKYDYPMSFAGTEPVFLLDLMGALGEALEKDGAYERAAQILKDAEDKEEVDEKALANKLFIDPDAPLAYSFYFLKQFYKNKYLTPAFKDLRNKDINSYLEQRVTNIIFTTLSTHRSFNVKAISRYSSIYIPSKKRPEQRHFTATTVFAVPMTDSPAAKQLAAALLSTETQSSLSQLSGLAPVLANCSTPDRQSDDARFWVAATSTPYAGLGHEAELSQEQLKKLAREICNLFYY